MAEQDPIQQLEAARLSALKDLEQYGNLTRGLVPLLEVATPVKLRRWVADFIAETFANPTLSPEKKSNLALAVLPSFAKALDAEGQDKAVVRSIVQAASSIYPLVFKLVVYNPQSAAAWQDMTAVKSNILRRMDAAPVGIKVCCIKFIERVIQVQTPGVIADPRRPQQNETSLALVPQDHPLLPPPNLEAEALGLLDRLLDVFNNEKFHHRTEYFFHGAIKHQTPTDKEPSDALLVSATLNSIGILVRTRASVSTRILNAILNFDPSLLRRDETPSAKVVAKSVERTIRAFLINLSKRAQNGVLAGRIQGYLDRLAQLQAPGFEEQSRKRGAPADLMDGQLDSAKRQRTEPISPLPPGPLTVAQVYALTTNASIRGFDVQTIQPDYMPGMVTGLLRIIDKSKLEEAVAIVHQRWEDLTVQPGQAGQLALGAGTVGGGDTQQLLNAMQAGPIAEEPIVDEPLGTFQLPQPPPLSSEEVEEYGTELVHRVMMMIETAESKPNDHAGGVDLRRLAGSGSDRDYWTTIAIRLATRSLIGLTGEQAPRVNGLVEAPESTPIAAEMRQSLFRWIIADWRGRLNTAIQWLNEEWLNDRIQRQMGIQSANYELWSSQILASICSYVDASERKQLIRYLSEVPTLSDDDLERVKRLAEDPERIMMVIHSFLFLILFKPPVREKCLDLIEDLYLHYPEAKREAAKILKKHRPETIQRAEETAAHEAQVEAQTDGVKKEEDEAKTSVAIAAAS